LVRDAAYESMLRSTRRGWHERIARTLIDHFPERVDQRPELLAWHLEEAGDLPLAIDQRKRAGDRATARGAYSEAIRHFEKGAALVQRLERGRERLRRELAIDESLGTALFSTRGYAAKEVQETFARARALCDELGGAIPFRVLWGLWAGQITHADERGTAELLRHFDRLALEDPTPVHRLGAHAAASTRALYTGDFEAALDESRKALAWWTTPEAQAFAREYGYDIGIYAIANEMVALNWMGEFALAAGACERMLEAAEKAGNPYGLAIARGHAMNFFLERDELDTVLTISARQISEATEQRLYLWIGPAMCTRGWAAARRGDAASGLQQVQQGLALCDAIGFRVCKGLHLMALADAQRRSGDADAALAAVQAGLDHCAATVDRFYAPELLRVRGELRRELGDLDAAEADLRSALEHVQASGARGLEPRVACSLAELLTSRGVRDEARSVLRRACDALSPAVDIADLRRARALLAQMG
jgi:tetratricopeptide (TPR) repeat protein